MWLTGLVAPRHVGSSQTRARTRVPCIGRQTLNHCATREAQLLNIFMPQFLYQSNGENYICFLGYWEEKNELILAKCLEHSLAYSKCLVSAIMIIYLLEKYFMLTMHCVLYKVLCTVLSKAHLFPPS